MVQVKFLNVKMAKVQYNTPHQNVDCIDAQLTHVLVHNVRTQVITSLIVSLMFYRQVFTVHKRFKHRIQF